MKKDWNKKCTCENFQQDEDCEHIGNKVLEEVGLGVGDKDCPDCRPDDGCAKHYIKNGDRHDRLEGALTPLGEKYMEEEKLKKIVEKVNRAYPEIAKLISETDIDWYGLRSFDEANPPKIIRKRIHPPIKN